MTQDGYVALRRTRGGNVRVLNIQIPLELPRRRSRCSRRQYRGCVVCAKRLRRTRGVANSIVLNARYAFQMEVLMSTSSADGKLTVLYVSLGILQGPTNRTTS